MNYKKPEIQKVASGQMVLKQTFNDIIDAVNNLYDLTEFNKISLACPGCGARLNNLKCDYCGIDYNLRI